MRKATNKNWQRVTAAAAALALCAGVLTGCGASSSTAASSTAASSAASEMSSEEADEMAAKNVADLIDAIYVQERNENTDAQCEAAKAAWDALTDAQKEMVEGEEASPEYFGRDTGAATSVAPTWRDRWDDRNRLPLLVRIDVTPKRGPAWPTLVVAPRQAPESGCRQWDSAGERCVGMQS